MNATLKEKKKVDINKEKAEELFFVYKQIESTLEVLDEIYNLSDELVREAVEEAINDMQEDKDIVIDDYVHSIDLEKYYNVKQMKYDYKNALQIVEKMGIDIGYDITGNIPMSVENYIKY